MSLAFYEKIKSNKQSKSGEFKNIKFGVCEMQGWRNEMEDSNCVCLSKFPNDEWSFYAVFDGHGGNLCSKLSSEYLWCQIYEELLKKSNNSSQFRINSLNEEDIVNSIKYGFYNYDKKLLEKVKNTDPDDKSGTTVVAALVTATHIYLINCGDSRGILVRGNKIELNTYDHKPTQLKERQRIQNAGGLVALNRVNGGLATSRGLGDFEYKNVPNLDQTKQFVTCEPDIFHLKRHPTDKFILLACDGIWDVMDNESVKEFVEIRNQETSLYNEKTLEKMNEDLLVRCFEKGSKDNMSVITIFFNNFSNYQNNPIADNRIQSGRGNKRDTNSNIKNEPTNPYRSSNQK